jgi:hypothetical protein
MFKYQIHCKLKKTGCPLVPGSMKNQLEKNKK